MTQPRSKPQWFLEGFSLLLVILMFAMLAVHWSQFPDQVPAHYGISGTPNGWHGKSFLLILPSVAALIWIVLTAAETKQHLINIPFEIDRSSPQVQQVLRNMVITEKAFAMIVFAWLAAMMVRTALGLAQGLGAWFLPVSLALIFAPLIMYSVELLRLRK
jgi:uncharacterized membrane protein